MIKISTFSTIFTLIILQSYTASAQLGCAGAGQGNLTVELINVSAVNQGQDGVLTAEYEYSFYFTVRDNAPTPNSTTSGCWEWDPNDNQSNSVSPGSSGTPTFEFNQNYSGCSAYGLNLDMPSQLTFSFDGWEDDSGGRCSYNTGPFQNNDDDRATCNGNTVDLANVFTNCPGGSASYNHTWSCGDYTMTYRITLTLPLFDPSITGAPNGAICNTATPINLTAATPGGTWSGMGVSANGVFSPSALSSGNYTVTYFGVNGCVTTFANTMITVINPDANFVDPPTSVCVDNGPIALDPTEPIGSWAALKQGGGAGVIINNAFDPALSGPGIYTISYTVGNATINCTETRTATNTIEVTPLPEFDIISPEGTEVACNTTFSLSANELSSATPGNHTFLWDGRHIIGSYTDPSVEINSNVGDIADYLLTITDANGCQNTISFTVTFNCNLPIELLFFEGEAVDFGVNLGWATAAEENNEGFALYRSLDGIDFKEIDFIAGAGSTLDRSDYNYFDQEVLPSTIYYYQLHQIDLDGSETRSGIVSVETSARGSNPDVFISNAYPNPVKGTVNIDVNSPLSYPMEIEVYDMAGKLMMKGKQEVQAGFSQVRLDLSDLPMGLLNVVMKMNTKVYHRKVVKVNY